MSEAAPEGGRPRGGGQAKTGLKKQVAGMPLWSWMVLIGAGAGALLWIKLRKGSSSAAGDTSTSSPVSTAGTVPDDTTSTSEYENVSSQLTGIEGTQEALLAAVKDLQGADSGSGGGPAGTGTATVPDIVGDRGAAARAKVAAAGLIYKQDPATTEPGRETEVTSQSPHAGTQVAKGSDVTAQVKVRAAADDDDGQGGGGSSSGGGSSGGGGANPPGTRSGGGGPPKRGGSAPPAPVPPSRPVSKAPPAKPAPRKPPAPKPPTRRIGPVRRK